MTIINEEHSKMAIRMKVLFLLAIIAASCAQSTDPNAPEDTLPDESTTGPIDPITESPPQTEEIAPAGGGPIESPPAGGETTDPSPIDDEVTGFPIDPIPIEETSEPIPEDPFSQPSETTGDPDTTGPTEPPPDSSTDAPVLSQRSFLRRPLPAEPAPTEPTPSDPQPGQY